MDVKYTYEKEVVAQRLAEEIAASTIATAISYLTVLGNTVDIFFKAELSPFDEVLLGEIVAAHVPTPMPEDATHVNVESEPPFAEPLYRTKRSRTLAPIYIPPGATKVIDFILPEERYVAGGAIIVENGKFKDSIKASVHDYYEAIPEEYRSTLCEDWPTVAEYIEGEWLEYAGEPYTVHKINTQPLNAKITQSLSLRITYSAYEDGVIYRGDWEANTTYAVNDVCSYGNKAYKCIKANTGTLLIDGDTWVKVDSRCVLVNYSLTKKL